MNIAQSASSCAVLPATMSPAHSAEELAELLYQTLFDVFLVLGRRVPHGVLVGDLTPAQLSILMALRDHGPMRMTTLAAYERVRTPTTTVAIRRLVNLKLVARSADPTDRRAVLVRITPHKREVCCDALASRLAHLAAMLNTLSAVDRAILNQAMPSLEQLAGQGKA
jgi:DNA-binding MarR family transcriptional regulator